MELPDNTFKRAIAAHRLQIGLWSSLCSNIAAEIIAQSGFDWILLDTEHSPNELPGLLSQLQALACSPVAPIVRPAWNDPVLIKRILDIGAQTVLVPFVQSAEDAARAVTACRYPPEGIRGVTASGRASRYGRVPNYLARANLEICVLVQIETQAGLDALEDIAAVDHVDGVFIGPSDLAASLGQIGNPGHADVQAAIADAARRLKSLAMPSGILAARQDDARRYIDWGFTFAAVGSDLGILAHGADALARSFKVMA